MRHADSTWIDSVKPICCWCLGSSNISNFIRSTRLALVSWLVDARPPHLDIILPIGISFYTFRHDFLHRRQSRNGQRRRAISRVFACYVSLFAQLWPVQSGGRLSQRDLDDIDKYKSTKHPHKPGLVVLLHWPPQTVLIADSLALIIQPRLKDYASLSTVDCLAVHARYS